MAKKKSQEDLVTNLLEQIKIQLDRQNSPSRVFVLGLVRGFGTALGATVLLAIATSLTIHLLSSIDTSTFLEYFFSNSLPD